MQIHRPIIRFSSALLLLFALALTSCINDRYDEDMTAENKGIQLVKGHTYSLFFNIETGNMGTRTVADDIEKAGSGNFVHGDENAIGQGNYMFLFSENGDLLKVSELLLTGDQDHGHDGYIEACYEAKFSPDDFYLRGDPKQCLVVLNGQHIYNLLEKDKIAPNTTVSYSMDDILELVWYNADDPTSIGRTDDDNKLFTMTNSVYVKDGQVQAAVEISDDNIIEEGETLTAEELAEKIVDIHVERMVAKFTFEMINDNPVFTPTNHTITYCTFDEEGSPIYTEKDFQICVTGWGINALESQNYIFKKVNPTIDYFTNWNDLNNYRTYWCEDSHYSDEKYPWQFRKAVNNSSIIYYEMKYVNAQSNENILKNYSYSELNNSDFNRSVYTPENTYDVNVVKDKLDSREHLLAGTHLIVCANLESRLNDEEGYQCNNLWRDRTGVYYNKVKMCFWSLVRQFNYALQSHVYMNFTRYNWGENDSPIEVGRAALTMIGNYVYENQTYLGTEYKLYHGNSEVTYDYIMTLDDDLFISAIVEDGDGKVLPWLEGLTVKGTDGTSLGIFNKIVIDYDDSGTRRITGDCERLRDASEDDIKSLLFEWVGAVDYFNQGKMYYAAPAKLHQNANSTMGTTNIFGVVRNNWYQYILNDIQTIGTSVDKIDEPIVPNKVITNDQLNITVKLIDWHSYYIDAPVL